MKAADPARPPFDLARARERGDTVGLSFSNGKDSLAAWLYLRENGFKIVPFYMQIVPGLEFVENSIRFYESFFGVHVYRLTLPNAYMWLNNFHSQPVERFARLAALFGGYLPLFKYQDVEQGFRRTAGLRLNTWIAVGIKASDSAIRSGGKAGTGYDPKRNVFHPLRRWSEDDVVRILKDYRCPLPTDYELFGSRSFDGFDARFLLPIKERYPADYRRILEWAPDARHELSRLEVATKHGQVKGANRGKARV